MKPEASLCHEDAADRLIDPRFGQRTPLHRLPQAATRGAVVRRMQDDVVPGQQCARRSLGRGGQLRDRAHPHRIGEHKPVEADLLPQELVDDSVAEGRGRRGGHLDRRQDDVRGHHAVNAGRDPAAKRSQLHTVEPIARVR